MLNNKAAMYMEFEEFDKASLGKDVFAELVQLENKTLAIHRAFKTPGDTVFIATEHLRAMGL